MDPATALQTFTSAITVVQLAYKTFRFFEEISNAPVEAQILRQKTARLYQLVKAVYSRLDIRQQIRGNATPPEEEEEVESTVRESLRACRQCLYRLNRKLRGLTTDQPLNLHHRIAEGFRFTISRAERTRQERALETNIQALTTSLHLLQLLEHDNSDRRLARLERSLAQAVAHLHVISEQLLSPIASPAMGNGNPAQIDTAAEDADLSALWSLRRTIDVAQSTASQHGSNFDPDRLSLLRISGGADSDSDSNEEETHRDSGPRPAPDRLSTYGDVVADTPEPSQVNSIGLGIAEPIDDPVRSSWRPPAILSRYKHEYQEAAEKEYNKGNFVTAEEYQKKAFDQAEQLEQGGHEPFAERKQMRQRLVEIFMKQDKQGEAARELHNLLREAEPETNHEQIKEHAELWAKLARVHHAMFLACRDSGKRDVAAKNIETAETYAIVRAFSRLDDLHEAGHISHDDKQFQSCVMLIVQILEDQQGKVVEAGAWRKHFLAAAPPTPLLPVTSTTSDHSGEITNEDKAEEEFYRQLKLLDTPGRPRISNAIVFNFPERFQEILEDKLTADQPDLDERCQDKNWTPLMYAVACDHKASCSCDLAIEKLVHNGANLNAIVGQGKDVDTALHQAVSAGRGDKVHKLLHLGADKDVCKPYTPLTTAVKKNQAQIVELLLERGAEAPVDDNGWTLLHHAVASSAFDAFTVLLRDEYADKFHASATCRSRKTALLLCAEYAGRPLSRAMAEELLKRGAAADARDDIGRTPLHWATNRRFDPAQTERNRFVALLLRHGASADAIPERLRGHRAFLWQYPAIRAAGWKPSPADARRRDSAASGSSAGGGVVRRDSDSTFRSLDTVNTRESGISNRLRLTFRSKNKRERLGARVSPCGSTGSQSSC